MQIEDPQFWRAGAISIVVVMLIVLVMLTVDSLKAIDAGGSHVPLYSVINQKIGYKFDAARGVDVPTIGEKEPLFGHEYSDQDAGVQFQSHLSNCITGLRPFINFVPGFSNSFRIAARGSERQRLA